MSELPAAAFALVAEFRAKSGREEDLRALTIPLVAMARSEPTTCLFYLHEDREAAGRFLFYEVYASEADFEAHRAKPHVQAWFGRLPDLTEAGVSVTHLRLVGPR